MGVKTQHLGFLNDCWPVKGVPCGAITVLGQMGILAVDPQSVLGGRGRNLGLLVFGWHSLVYRVSYQAFFLNRCDSELFS